MIGYLFADQKILTRKTEMNHQKDRQEEIIIFTRYPEAGRVKTRLIPELGAQGAADMHRTMTEHVVRTAGLLAEERQVRVSVCHDGGSAQQMEQWLGPDLFYFEQAEGDLGRRMLRALADAWDRGAARTVLAGSDCPGIDRQIFLDALIALKYSQLVLGPAADGGYYLIGAANGLPLGKMEALLTGIAWGTGAVFRQTLDRTRSAGVTVSILKELHDIDHPGDLAYFHHHPRP